MDIRMPRLDGLAATRQILTSDEPPRVLVLTTFDLDEYVFEALNAGASGFVLKDDPPEKLVDAIRTVAAGEALLSPAVTRRVIARFTRLARPARPPGLVTSTGRGLAGLWLGGGGVSDAGVGGRALTGGGDAKKHTT